jgi:arsenate reductase (glutaredoxin)
MEVWFNPACSKCRSATTALDEAGVDYTIRRYLDEPPTADELRAVLDRLGVEPWHVARAKEAREAGIDLPKDAGHRDDWVAAMVANPRVIQRPIITADDGTTVVGRDPEALTSAIEAQRRSAPES